MLVRGLISMDCGKSSKYVIKCAVKCRVMKCSLRIANNIRGLRSKLG